jgi:hypothetical protein
MKIAVGLIFFFVVLLALVQVLSTLEEKRSRIECEHSVVAFVEGRPTSINYGSISTYVEDKLNNLSMNPCKGVSYSIEYIRTKGQFIVSIPGRSPKIVKVN